MTDISIERARELLGDETYRLPDAIIQDRIDKAMILANRFYDIIENQNKQKHDNENSHSI